MFVGAFLLKSISPIPLFKLNVQIERHRGEPAHDPSLRRNIYNLCKLEETKKYQKKKYMQKEHYKPFLSLLSWEKVVEYCVVRFIYLMNNLFVALFRTRTRAMPRQMINEHTDGVHTCVLCVKGFRNDIIQQKKTHTHILKRHITFFERSPHKTNPFIQKWQYIWQSTPMIIQHTCSSLCAMILVIWQHCFIALIRVPSDLFVRQAIYIWVISFYGLHSV